MTLQIRCLGVVFLLLFSPCAVEAAISYPLHVSADGRHVVDDAGSPVLFSIETAWLLLKRLPNEQAIEYLDNRRAKGFNAILIMLPVPEWDGTITNWYGDPPFDVPGDFSTPNAAYWAHADWLLDQADQRGFVVFAAPAYVGWGCVNQGFCAEMQAAGVDAMRAWGQWIGTRYRDQPNLVWVNGGDVDAAAFGAGDVVDAVAYGILDVDPDHLHTAHCSRYNSSADCYDRPWLDINATYADCQQTPLHTRTNYQAPPSRPIFLIEGRYEFEKDWTDGCIRSQAYWTILGGGTGHTFGSGVVHLFAGGWRDGMESQGSLSMFHFEQLLNSRAWSDLVPDYAHTVLVGGYGDISTDQYAAAAATANGQTILVYAPTPRLLTVSLDGLNGTTAEAWWYDPATGDATFEGSFPSSGQRSFYPPTSQDWVLVIDDEEAPLFDVWNPTTAIQPSSIQSVLQLDLPSPNPFNPRTAITFAAPAGQPTSVQIFDARGRQVAVLFEGIATGSRQTVSWTAQDAASGTYFVQVRCAGDVTTRKLAVVK